MIASPILGRGPVAKPGYPFIAVAGGITLIFWVLNWGLWAALGLVVTALLLNFFRNPQRDVPISDLAAIVSPADGKVVLTDEVQEPEFLSGPARRVAIFMNIFDVHVNRAPVAGRVVASRHRAGKFLAAYKAEVDRVNEKQAILWETAAGPRVLTVQIAGMLARRIVPAVKEGDVLAKGARFGMICFGSRVDLYLPVNCGIIVKVGDRVKAGESVVARWS
jgi:phosphatidylserine decarboxylase